MFGLEDLQDSSSVLGMEYQKALESVNNGLTKDQNSQLVATYNSAKSTGDTKLAKIMNDVFTYGKTALDILVVTGVIKNQNAISQNTVDTKKYQSQEADIDNEIKNTVGNKNNSTTNTPQSNSTYFGIDFSSPIVWLIIIGIVVLFFAFNSSSSKPQQVYIPQQPARK